MIADHEYPVAVREVFVYDQLCYAVFVAVGICICIRAAVCFDAFDNFQIALVLCLGIEQRFIWMIEVSAGFYIQKYIFAVGKALQIQTKQYVHQAAGIYAGAYVADAA